MALVVSALVMGLRQSLLPLQASARADRHFLSFSSPLHLCSLPTPYLAVLAQTVALSTRFSKFQAGDIASLLESLLRLAAWQGYEPVKRTGGREGGTEGGKEGGAHRLISL